MEPADQNLYCLHPHNELSINNEIHTWPEVIKLFSCSTQLSMKFILLINVRMPTKVGILILISKINTTYETFVFIKKSLFFSILVL